MHFFVAGSSFFSATSKIRQYGWGILTAFAAGGLLLSGCGGLQVSSSSDGSGGSIVSSTNEVIFGSTQIGQSVSSNVLISNPGTESVQVAQLNVTGAAFSVAGQAPAGFSVAPGATVTLSIGFDPSVVGDVDGELDLMGVASSATPLAKIHLHGTAEPILKAVSCANMSVTGAGSDACSVTLNYSVQTDVAVALTSSVSAISVPQTVTVAAGAASASFTATIAAVTTAENATISANTGSQTVSGSIQLGAATPTLVISASSVDFGTVAQGQARTESVTLSSAGTLPVTISSLSLSSQSFSSSGVSMPVTLNPGQSASLNLVFVAASAGNYTGVLAIGSNSSTGNLTVSLTAASAAAPALKSLTCSSVSMSGAGTDACTATLAVAAPPSGLSVSLASNDSAVTVPASVTVAANATSASFTATVAAVSTAQTATLTATGGGASATFALQLQSPAQKTLGVNATSISFGGVDVGDAATQSLTLSSTGSAAVTVNSVTATGTGFSASGATFPLTLNGGQTATLSVQFKPTATGAVTGQLTIVSNSSTGSTATVSLSGTGDPHEVQLTWNTPSSSGDPISGYRVYRASAGSSSYALLNSTLDTLASYMDVTGQTGASYQYYVTAVDSSGHESVPSNTATVKIP